MLESSREHQDKSLLPPHWIEVKSSVAEPGRDYYFNTKNKKSVWTVREALLSKNNITLRKHSSRQQFAPQPPTEPHELDGNSGNEKSNANWHRNLKKPQTAPQPSTEPSIAKGSPGNEQNVNWSTNIAEQQSIHNELSTRPTVAKDIATNTSQHANLWPPYTGIPPPFYPYNPTMPFGHDPNMPNWNHPNVMPPYMPMPPVFPVQRQIYNEKTTVTFANPVESASQFEHLKFPPTIPVSKSTDPPPTLFDDSETRTIEMGNLSEKIPIIKPGDLRYKLMARKRAKSVSEDSPNLDWKEAASTVPARRNSVSGLDKLSDDVLDQSKSDTDSSKPNEEDDDDSFQPLKGESFGYWLLREAKPDAVKDLVYICVDSNIFIQHLDLIEEILARDKEHICRILVTFRVLNELEKLKKARPEPSNVKRDMYTRKRVTTALSFLCEEAMKSPSYIITEKLPTNESERNMTRYNNDDDIIYRMMQYLEQNYHIILLTDDRAMTLKASLLNIRSYNVRNLRALFKKVEQQIEKRDALLSLKVSVKNPLANSQELSMGTNALPPPILVQPIPPFNPHIPPPTYVYPYEPPHAFPRPVQAPSASRPDQGFGKMSAALETIHTVEKDRTDNRSLRSMSSTNTTKSNDSFGRAIIKDVHHIPTVTTQRSSSKQQAQRSPYKQAQEVRKKIMLKRPAWNKPITPSTSNVPSNAWDANIPEKKMYSEPQNPFSAKTHNIQEKPISNSNTVDQSHNPFSVTSKTVRNTQERQTLNPNAGHQPHNPISTEKHQEKSHSNPKTFAQPVLWNESLSTHYPSITTASVASKSCTTTIDSSVPIVPTFASVPDAPAFQTPEKVPLGAQTVRTETKDDLNIPLTCGLRKKLENQMDIWVVMYVQIMEDVVTSVLLSERRFYMIPPPWSLHEALSTLAERFQCDNKALASAANELARHIDKFSPPRSHKSIRYAKLQLKTPEMFLKLYKDARALLGTLKVVQNLPAIETAEKDLESLLDQLRTTKMEREHAELLSELSSESKLADDDDSCTRDLTQTRDMDVHARVVQYLREHYESWRTAYQTKPTEKIKESEIKEPATADKTEKLVFTFDNGKGKTTELKGNTTTEQKIKKTIEQGETKTSGLIEMLKFKPIPEFESKLQNTNYYEFDPEIDGNIDEDFDDDNYEDVDDEMYDEMHEEIYEAEEEMEEKPEKISEDMTENDDKAGENMSKRNVDEIVEEIVDVNTKKITVDKTTIDDDMVDLEKDLSISENTNEINSLPIHEMVVDNVEALGMDKTADNTSVNSNEEEEYCKVGDALRLSILNYKMVSVQLAGEMDKPIVYEDGDATGLPPLPQIFDVAERFIQCLEKIKNRRKCDAKMLVDSLRALAPSVSGGLPTKPKQVLTDAVLVREVAKDAFVAALRSLKNTHDAMKKYYETTVSMSENKPKKKQKKK